MELELELQLPLRHFDLDIRVFTQCNVLGVFGRSGAGKTSLIEALCGLRPGLMGRLQVDGQTWLDTSSGVRVPPHRRRLGYVPQGSLLFPDRSTRANLRAGKRGAAAPELEAQVIEAFELGGLLDALPHELSGGEAQRVALGRAICSGARLLLLDEPTASLGAEFRERALPFLARVHSDFGIPMIVVSHEPLDLQVLCDDLVAVERGRVVSHGPPLEVLGEHLEGTRSATSLLRADVTSAEPHLSELRLEGEEDAPPVFVAGRVGELGQRVLVAIMANQVMLACQAPTGISALNVLPVTIRSITEHARFFSLELQVRGTTQILQCDLTQAARERVGFDVGSDMFAVVKAVSARVMPLAGDTREVRASPRHHARTGLKHCGRQAQLI